MSSAFKARRATQPVPAMYDDTWLQEIEATEAAVNLLLDAKRAVLNLDPQHEQVLWARHVDRLRRIKRKLDAVCL